MNLGDLALAIGPIAVIGAIAWLQYRLKQAEYSRLVRHFISLDRIALHAGIDRKDIWLGTIRRLGIVKYNVEFKGNLDGDKSGEIIRILELDGSQDYREIEKGVADHHREALENKREHDRKKA